ncbi:MAG: HDOD domain-containing protein [Proteobacteria bacterium]|nr:HDOD domain-containing protein [Pseudomonadota bacterium]
MKKVINASYGRGMTTVDSDEMDQLLKEDREFVHEIAMMVKQTLDSEDFKPPLLPEVAISLSKMAHEPNVSIREVEAVVQRDPVVAARVVAVANSAFYSRGTPIRSLRSAITRLGLAEVRDIAFQVVAQTRIFRVKGYINHVRNLFEAAQACGIIARKMCKMLRFESELAYLCGLLHDMGEAIILGIVGDNYNQRKLPVPPLDQLGQAIEEYHAAAGAKICNLWGLPDLIADALTYHQRPEQSNNASQMATVVAISDILLAHAGIATEQTKIDPLREPLFFRLNMTPEQVEDLVAFVESLAENPDGFMA